MQVAAVVLNFNDHAATLRCVASVLEGQDVGRVVVVDNGSSQADRALLSANAPSDPRVVLIRSEANLGFGGGMNLGINDALEHNANAVLLLNNDTIVEAGAVAELTTVLHDNPGTGAVVPVVTTGDGDRIWAAGGTFDPRSLKVTHRLAGHPDADLDDTVVTFAPGAALLVSAEVLRRVGGFVESFFLYVEDVELSWRIQRAGYSIRLAARARVWHAVQGGRRDRSTASIYYRARNSVWFGRKVLPPSRFWALLPRMVARALWVAMQKSGPSLAPLIASLSQACRGLLHGLGRRPALGLMAQRFGIEDNAFAISEIVLFNPLPQALHHYEQALRASLPHLRVSCVRVNFEIGRRGRFAKVIASVRPALAVLHESHDPRVHVVAWPAFGLADLAVWRVGSRRGHRFIVVHDPIPLRRQSGFGAVSRRLGAWGARGPRIHVVTHTRLAADELRRLDIMPEHVLPHPVVPRTTQRPRGAATLVLVAGQHKTARDLKLLTLIGEVADPTWSLRIAGRGWPSVPGWNVDNRFLPEDELDSSLAGASVVLLPYHFYFQSGVAMRAFELGVPVVTRRHEYIEALYGAHWPGLVDDDEPLSWVRAIESARAAPVPPPEDAAAHSAVAWAAALRPYVTKFNSR